MCDFTWEAWEVGDGEEAAGDGGQKGCRPWWEVELTRDCAAEEGGVEMLPLLLGFPLLLASPAELPSVPRIPAGLAKPFWCGGSRGDAVGGGLCFGGEGEGCGGILPITEPGL